MRLSILLLLSSSITSSYGFTSSIRSTRQSFVNGATNSGSSSQVLYASEYDYDVAIIGCGVGGHGAALHSRAQSLSTVVFSGSDVGGTCVNRGCVPSKALLAASGRVRDMKDAKHLADLGISVDGEVKFDRQAIADHAKNLANRVKGNLEASLIGLGVDVVEGRGVLSGKPHEILDESTGKIITAKVSTKITVPKILRMSES